MTAKNPSLRRIFYLDALTSSPTQAKPMSTAKKPPTGIQFPVDKKGTRSTSDAGKAIIAAALRGAGTDDGNRYADACEKEKNWRFGYLKHFTNLVKVIIIPFQSVSLVFYFHLFIMITKDLLMPLHFSSIDRSIETIFQPINNNSNTHLYFLLLIYFDFDFISFH